VVLTPVDNGTIDAEQWDAPLVEVRIVKQHRATRYRQKPQYRDFSSTRTQCSAFSHLRAWMCSRISWPMWWPLWLILVTTGIEPRFGRKIILTVKLILLIKFYQQQWQHFI